MDEVKEVLSSQASHEMARQAQLKFDSYADEWTFLISETQRIDGRLSQIRMLSKTAGSYALRQLVAERKELGDAKIKLQSRMTEIKPRVTLEKEAKVQQRFDKMKMNSDVGQVFMLMLEELKSIRKLLEERIGDA